MIEKKIVYIMLFTIAVYLLFTKNGLATIKAFVGGITNKNQSTTNQPQERKDLKQSGTGWNPNVAYG